MHYLLPLKSCTARGPLPCCFMNTVAIHPSSQTPSGRLPCPLLATPLQFFGLTTRSWVVRFFEIRIRVTRLSKTDHHSRCKSICSNKIQRERNMNLNYAASIDSTP